MHEAGIDDENGGTAIEKSFMSLGIRTEKSKLFHDYKSFATKGLKKLRNTGSSGQVSQRKQKKVHSVGMTGGEKTIVMRLDLNQKPKKLE